MAERPPDFGRFTQLVRDREPFAWQAELAEDWLGRGRLPTVIAVPTGLGKTSVIDCWAYALAMTKPGTERAIPLRLCVVVDRRLIVDAAFEAARELQVALEAARVDEGNPLHPIVWALASFSGGDAAPLECVRMRGGATWESRWLARPDQPAVIVGTVDQFGSRLLFRGYGASARMRPVDAALLGTDTWLVIDEAHIAAPLVATAGRVALLQETTARPVSRPLAVTPMTATPEGDSGEAPLRADPSEQIHSRRFPGSAVEAHRRLEASKPVALVELPRTKSKAVRERARQVGDALARLALRIDPAAELVGVLCNTVAAARAAHACLEAEGEEAALLIGRSREYERGRVLAEWLPRIGLGAERDGVRRYVVATQTIEVGANLDLDAAVSEVASIDSLVQRFGRVNRIGGRAERTSAVAHCGGYHEEDPVYGGASQATWEHMCRAACAEPLVATTARQLAALDVDGRHLDLGPLHARELADASPLAASRAGGYVPVLLGPDVERWAATYPGPEPDQAVAPFIRGDERSAPEVSIAWRVAPPVAAASLDGWTGWLAISRPVEWEFVSVPIWEARALVRGTPSEEVTADVEGTGPEVPEGIAEPNQADDALLGVAFTNDPGELTAIRSARDIRVGSHVVLRADLGGHDRWGWTGVRASEGDAMVPDVADLAPTRRRGVLRLERAVLASVLGPDAGGRIDVALRDLDPEDADTGAALISALASLDAGGAMAELLHRATAEGWLPDTVPLDTGDDGEPSRCEVLREPGLRRPMSTEAITDADPGSTSQVGSPESLQKHLSAVASLAGEFAEHLDLDDEQCRAVACAGAWHDLGKAEPRFQVMLHDGDEVAAMLAAAPLAKSGRDPADPLARRAARIAGVPRGFRHEAVSARIVKRLLAEHPELAMDLDLDLVHHLVASHHGCARPLFPPLVDEGATAFKVAISDPEPVDLEIGAQRLQVDWSHPARFEALCARYGWWGLALLESLVRLADMLASEKGGDGGRSDASAETAGAAR